MRQATHFMHRKNLLTSPALCHHPSPLLLSLSQDGLIVATMDIVIIAIGH